MATRTTIKPELLDELLEGRDPKTVFESEGLLDELKKALAERMLNAEMDHHLGQESEQGLGNHRNGTNPKTVLTDTGKLPLSMPRDRQGRFEAALIAKYQRRFPGFDEKIVALYARGMSTRDIQGHLRELYGTEISPELVSAVTDAVLDEVATWQSRPLEPVYAIVFFDCLRVKIRDEGTVKNKAVYLAIGVRCSGHREVLGIWIEQTEGAKFWLRVMTEIRNRGTGDVLIAVVDGPICATVRGAIRHRTGMNQFINRLPHKNSDSLQGRRHLPLPCGGDGQVQPQGAGLGLWEEKRRGAHTQGLESRSARSQTAAQADLPHRSGHRVRRWRVQGAAPRAGHYSEHEPSGQGHRQRLHRVVLPLDEVRHRAWPDLHTRRPDRI
jgi:putative transposase